MKLMYCLQCSEIVQSENGCANCRGNAALITLADYVNRVKSIAYESGQEAEDAQDTAIAARYKAEELEGNLAEFTERVEQALTEFEGLRQQGLKLSARVSSLAKSMLVLSELVREHQHTIDGRYTEPLDGD